MQYEYFSTDKDRFSLHDCTATTVKLTDGKLIFYLPNGFFCEHSSNAWCNTGEAEIEFVINSIRDVTLDLFVESEGRTFRNACTAEHLIERINNKEWELEFAYRYDGYEEILYKCWIWEQHGPETYEGELWIRTKEETVFRWNPPKE